MHQNAEKRLEHRNDGSSTLRPWALDMGEPRKKAQIPSEKLSLNSTFLLQQKSLWEHSTSNRAPSQ
jgi:hypothetical protein